MNEASSKFVDHIAIEKLLSEKLNKVHHYPDDNIENNIIDFDSLVKLKSEKIFFEEGIEETESSYFHFTSLVNSGYKENDEVKIFYHRTTSDKIIGNIIFIHGLYEDNKDIYKYFISMLNKEGINVYVFILPFHYERKPIQSFFSGEYFWSGNIDRSILAFAQSIYDLSVFYNYIKSERNEKTIVTGFSMGGGISLCLASNLIIDGLFAINPVSNITSLVWNSKLFSTVKNDFETVGLTFEKVKQSFEKFEPMEVEKIKTPKEKIFIGYSLYDQVNDPKNYELLINKWNMENVQKYKAGHLNVFRVPKLINDIKKLFLS